MCFAVARRPCSSSTAFEVAVGLVTVELLPTGGRVAALGRIASRLRAGLVTPRAGVRSSLALPGFVGPGASADGKGAGDTGSRGSGFSAVGAAPPPRLTLSRLRISNWLG